MLQIIAFYILHITISYLLYSRRCVVSRWRSSKIVSVFTCSLLDGGWHGVSRMEVAGDEPGDCDWGLSIPYVLEYVAVSETANDDGDGDEEDVYEVY